MRGSGEHLQLGDQVYNELTPLLICVRMICSDLIIAFRLLIRYRNGGDVLVLSGMSAINRNDSRVQ